MIINIGSKPLGYRQIQTKNALAEMGVPQEALDIKPNKLSKAIKIATKSISFIEIGLLALDVFAQTGFAHSHSMIEDAIPASGDLIDLSPLDTLQHEIWLLMLKGILYLAIPVFGWCGYVFALAGNNASKRTTAKWIALAMAGGIAFVAGAPWAANATYVFFKTIFHV